MPILIIQSSKVKSSYNVNISSKFNDLFSTIHHRKGIKLFLSSKIWLKNMTADKCNVNWLIIHLQSF